MIQDATLLADSNLENAYEPTETAEHAEEQRAKRRKINCHTSKNALL
ncbi:9557_t:CDS:2 [Racocetra persica]|uniref:9557_t:CDS:1 n=1 Tax=Racocetra persica TaxID=160502 RepID=A0ACA9PTA0_9GLOM|nr:9557_t:CDS:2 [Racocetra persica]